MLRERIWQHSINPELITLFTGSIYSEKTSAGDSAIADSGICIYYAALKNPAVEPSQLLRQRIVLGHIERDGFTYQKVSDETQSGVAAPGLADLGHFASRLGPNTELQLVVEETLNSKLVEAKFHVKTQAVAVKQVGRFEHSHDFSPTTCSLLQPDPSSVMGSHFGVAELRRKVMARMHLHVCYNFPVEIVTASFQSSNSLNVSWAGPCSLAISDVWKDPRITGQFLPKLGDWILTSNSKSFCCRKLLRGSYPVLYSIICLADETSFITLNSSRPCFICSPHTHYTYTNGSGGTKFSMNNLAMIMYSAIDQGSYAVELASLVRFANDKTTDIEAAGTKAAPPLPSQEKELQLQKFYNSKRKHVLKGILQRRAISFRKNTTKKAMIRLLQEHDVQNPLAATEDGFLEDNDEDAMVLG
ncbi:hypothetical protein EG329_000912 [Mollisiaceae sp. DMI_Dod_QoI]|nr:hypothetical protein EG329_000912 [Helotiales sp. DMI_Dod_QoI]